MSRRWIKWSFGVGVAFMLLVLLYPSKLPDHPYSTVLNDQTGQLLNAKVANDGQWRFPKPDSIPDRVATCIRLFEDEHFYKHPGVNPFSIGRALWQNLRSGKVVSGASTITMQVARMARGNRRSIWNKLDEMLFAMNLELFHSKEDIFKLYATMAPFGGNVVGLEAASWRYYGRAPHLLSWAEAAALAVLPNNPGMIYPGSSDSLLLAKRNFLLRKLHFKEIIDDQTLELALDEPVPSKPLPLPSNAMHLHSTFSAKNSGKRLTSTIDPFWQARVTDLAERHQSAMAENGVENLAAMVVDLKDGSVLSYVGNTSKSSADSWEVDVIHSQRSPGSSLKPFLYAAAMDRGLILRRSMLPDVPSFFGGYVPKNFNDGYLGTVNAHVALSRSLNIPMAHLLAEYGYEQFHHDLKQWGITSMDQPPGHYGLTMILGGGEVKMWDMAQVYFSMFQKLSQQPNRAVHYDNAPEDRKSFPLGQDAIWQTFRTMTTLSRPDDEKAWRSFNSSQLIAWKTGTSHGHRDAWAIGLNGSVLVLVWVGNADGEGRADLTGIKAAAPLLHQIIRLSEYDPGWLENLKPFMRKADVCTISGMLAGENCQSEEQEVAQNAENSGLCPYHKKVILDADRKFRVTSDCYSLTQSTEATAFVLPPTEGHYYRQWNYDYTGFPPMHPDCLSESNPIAILYPIAGNKIFIPREIDGNQGRAIFQATHQEKGAKLFWHIDNAYAGSSEDDHQLPVWLKPGSHVVHVMDENGNGARKKFEVIGETK